ncbi:DegT/DnrJ/EryC1/StrS family aminotransferase [soil metagenome]
MNVPLLDLKSQYIKLKPEIDAALIKCAESQYFILGPEVTKLEESLCKYLQCKHAFGVSSGTDALLLALMAIGISAGDEVIMPTYSFFATAGVVSRLNAIPVLCEHDPVTFNIDPAKIEALITPKTRAIIPVHLFGQAADMAPIMEIAKKHKLRVIEDAAQAIGTQYKDGTILGNFGDIGCFSFYPSKNLGGFGDSGLVTTNDDELAETLKIMRVHGGKPKYYHKVIGGNFRIDELQAVVLNVKLPHLQEWTETRQRHAKIYNGFFVEKGLAEKEGMTEFNEKNNILFPAAVYEDSGVKNYHIYNQYVIRVEKRDELRKFLQENNIGTEIYYPVPFHLQECFKDLGYKKGDFKLSEFSAETSLALPVYPELSDAQILYTCEKIKEFFDK